MVAAPPHVRGVRPRRGLPEDPCRPSRATPIRSVARTRPTRSVSSSRRPGIEACAVAIDKDGDPTVRAAAALRARPPQRRRSRRALQGAHRYRRAREAVRARLGEPREHVHGHRERRAPHRRRGPQGSVAARPSSSARMRAKGLGRRPHRPHEGRRLQRPQLGGPRARPDPATLALAAPSKPSRTIPTASSATKRRWPSAACRQREKRFSHGGAEPRSIFKISPSLRGSV